MKSESQVLRLASTLTYLDWASLGDESGTGVGRISAGMEPDEVPESCMVAATRLLCEYFWPHARAALRQIGLTDRHRDLRRALRWIKANGRREVSLREIRRDAFGASLDAERTRDLLDRLVTAGWLRPEKTDTGGRPLERWHVNPRIFQTAETAITAQSSSHSTIRAFLQLLRFLLFK